ncbi:helix-turn-helix domain-containing protein [Pseudonocardia ailaonensis]|uniref:Helix-turn-helix domain-containing protein n=1 Tax=Pseudonocardia ailaonensis TaxID=367279 RepID=A0ABN2N6K3_9PSEU
MVDGPGAVAEEMSPRAGGADERVCTIGRVISVVGDKWTLRILCEAALNGVSRFTEFQDLLGIATDVLAQRLTKLVDEGLLTKESYKEPGQRARFRYELTGAGGEMRLVLAALQQWGDVHRPGGSGLTEVGRTLGANKAVRVDFVDEDDAVVPADHIAYRYAI